MKKIFTAGLLSFSFITAFSQGTVTLFEDANFSGRSSALRAGTYASAAIAGISNDALTSLTIPAGMTVVLYENDNFSGRSVNLTGNIVTLADRGWNDMMSSVAVYDNATMPVPGNNRNAVVLYENDNFRGRKVALKPGTYSSAAAAGFRNDVLSSITIPAGMSVTLYEDDNLSGASVTLTGNQSSLTPAGWNDRMSSIVVSSTATPGGGSGNGVVLFQDSQYSGGSITLAPGRYNSMAAAGFPNDALSSVQIPRGYTVILYENDNLRGRSVTLRASIADLAPRGWNDKVSSLIVVKN